jgi:peptidoglycan/LPS O-acetylase OafA/YrhL
LIFGGMASATMRASFTRALPYYTLYLQEIPFFGNQGSGVPLPFYQSWSLGIEEKFYLLWPALAFGLFAARRHRLWLAATGLVLFSAAPYIWTLGRYVGPYAPIFSGCLLALLMDEPRLAMRLRAALLGWRAWGAAAFLLLVHGLTLAPDSRISAIATVLYPLPVSLVLIASLNPGPLGKLLSLAPITLLGELSYGIYLIHLLVRNLAEQLMMRAGLLAPSGLVVYVAMLALAVPAAVVLQRVVELPIRDYGRRLAARL